MNRRDKAVVIRAITHVQKTLSGRPCPRITAKTIPCRDLPGFDELNALETIMAIEDDLQITIPNDTNIFTDTVDGRLIDLSVGQIVDQLAKTEWAKQ